MLIKNTQKRVEILDKLAEEISKNIVNFSKGLDKMRIDEIKSKYQPQLTFILCETEKSFERARNISKNMVNECVNKLITQYQN